MNRSGMTVSTEEMERQKEFTAEIRQMPGRPESFYVVTYGCQMNAHDSEKLSGMLKEMGMTEAEAWQAQEIYRKRYTTVGLFENRVYPGIRNVLRTLKKQGAHIDLVSGKPEGSSRRILDCSRNSLLNR